MSDLADRFEALSDKSADSMIAMASSVGTPTTTTLVSSAIARIGVVEAMLVLTIEAVASGDAEMARGLLREVLGEAAQTHPADGHQCTGCARLSRLPCHQDCEHYVAGAEGCSEWGEVLPSEGG